MEYGIAVYLRNLSMCLDKVARGCPDERTRDAIVAICLDLADKAHIIETTFVISKEHRGQPAMIMAEAADTMPTRSSGIMSGNGSSDERPVDR